MYVDEWDAGMIRRVEGLVAMSSTADSGMPDPRRGLRDFAEALDSEGMGPLDSEFCRRLWTACAGRVHFAQAVVRAANDAGVPVEPASVAFSNWVAELCPPLNLSLGSGDESAVVVLAQLSVVSETTALHILTAVADELLGASGINDPDSVIERLQTSGVLIRIHDADRGALLQVPTLLAAKIRRDLDADSRVRAAVETLLSVLIEHMESPGQVDAGLLSDVLLLARRGGHWSALLRIAEAVGISMFLLAPESACAAFRLLPPRAREAGSGLEFFGTLAEDIIAGARDWTPAGIRAAAVEQTGPGMLRSRLPGTHTDGKVESGRVEDSRAMKNAGHASPDESRPVDFIGTVRQMIGLADAGRHPEAATLGMQTATQLRSARTRSIILLLTAIALHHAAEPRRALSILHEIESSARAGHTDGDFLLPAINAWTALISVLSGDHERADEHLPAINDSLVKTRSESEPGSAQLRRSDPMHQPPTVIIDELVTPPLHIAQALRSLDRLDLDRTESELEALIAYPEKRTLWVYLPFIARILAVLSAEAESGLLFVNDDAERFRDSGVLSGAEKNLLAVGRSMVFIALGQLRWAEIERERLSPSCDARIVLDVRMKLIAGHSADAIACADTWFYHRTLSPRGRAELVALRAAAQLRSGDTKAARSDFSTAVSLSAWVSSLLPLALLPRADRSRLIDLTVDSPAWAEAANEFSDCCDSPADLMTRLRAIGPVAVEVASTPQLNAAEARLIDLLARGLSVAEIAAELNQVTGTVKNRLSALYRKFGVTNRAGVLSRARSSGFLADSQSEETHT